MSAAQSSAGAAAAGPGSADPPALRGQGPRYAAAGIACRGARIGACPSGQRSREGVDPVIGDDPPRAVSTSSSHPESGYIDDSLKKLDDLKREGAANRYLVEAMACLRAGSNSATVLMCWNAFVLVLRNKIGELGLGQIQAALGRIGPRSGTRMASIHNLADIDYADLVRLGRHIGLYDQGVAQRLDSMRGVRNSAAHASQEAEVSGSDVHAFIDGVHQFAGIVSRARLRADGPMIDRMVSLDPHDMHDEVRVMTRPLAASCAEKALAEVAAIAVRESPRAKRLLAIASACIDFRCTDNEKLDVLHSLSHRP